MWSLGRLVIVRSLGNSDLSHVTSVGEVVITRAHVTVFPRLLDAETRRVAGGWGIVQLILKWLIVIWVTSLVQVKVQIVSIEFIMVNHFKRQAGTCCWFERTTSFLYPAHVGAIGSWILSRSQFKAVHYHTFLFTFTFYYWFRTFPPFTKWERQSKKEFFQSTV